MRREQRAGARLAGVEELELVIEKLVAGGEGLGRFEGIPIFVPRSAPGDRLRVRLSERRPDYGRAEILEILEPGPGRRTPPCRYFAECGGCDLQHLEDELQPGLKAAALLETLVRLGGVDPVPPVELVTGAAWGYRLRTQLHTAAAGGRPVVGYFARGSHRLVAVEGCPILVPELEALLPGLSRLLPAEPPRRIDLAAGDPAGSDAAGGDPGQTTPPAATRAALSAAPAVGELPRGEIELTVGRYRYRFDARCFFQTHRGLLGELVAATVGEASGELAVDLYAGVGLFTLPLAGRYARVVAVEGDRVAARYARRNAERHRLGNVEVVTQAVESWAAELPAADRVVVDPPRAGLPLVLVEALTRRRPARLTYVSCHAGALARDLRRLASAYRCERLTLLDLFPQTGHMEAVAQLDAR